ncbi:MAG: thymidylate synthase [Planctomycetota bacterium]
MDTDEKKRPVRLGDIPVLHVTGRTLPEAWERAVMAVWDEGVAIRTEYDREDAPPSLDATVMVHVESPMAEPRLHKNIPGGPTELEVYRQEVVEGIHDHWINPEEGKWTYTYHERLFGYSPVDDLQQRDSEPPFDPVNQIDYIVDKLAETPYSRRAQAITWMPQADPTTYDPPCLQRVWARLLTGEDGFQLNFNAHWRSRDLLMAWFMNVFALTDLQSILAQRLAERLGENVHCGRYVDVSDSLHIYGQYRNEKWEGEVEKMRNSSYMERSWNSDRMAPIFEETRQRLASDPDYYARGDGA